MLIFYKKNRIKKPNIFVKKMIYNINYISYT